MHIKDYIKIFHKNIDSALINILLTELKIAGWHKHQYYNNRTKQFESQPEKELYVSFLSPSEAHDNLMSVYWDTIKQYISELNYDWFNEWAGFTDIRFNKYPKGSNMKPHCDHIHSMFDGEIKGVPILSVLSNLNDDYKGGDFYLAGEKINMQKGDTIIFPSNFMYPHYVTDVTEGERFSCISWVY